MASKIVTVASHWESPDGTAPTEHTVQEIEAAMTKYAAARAYGEVKVERAYWGYGYAASDTLVFSICRDYEIEVAP